MSWKKYGGINKYDTTEHIVTNTLAVDKLTIKDYYYGVLDISGSENVSGNITSKSAVISKDLMIYNSSILNGEVFVYGDTVISGDISQVGNQDVSGDMFIAGDLTIAGNIGLENSLVLLSDFVLQNKMYFASDNSTYIYGINGGYLGMNIETPAYQFDISSEFPNILNVYSAEDSTYSVLSRNKNNRGILIGNDTSNSYIEFFNDTEINTSELGKNYSALMKYETGGVLLFDLEKMVDINAKIRANNHGEYFAYLPNYYSMAEQKQTNTGIVVNCENERTTSIQVGTNESGISIVGGTYPMDTTSSFGSIGLNVASTYTPIFNMISNPNMHNKTSVGINTYMPNRNSTLDVNGAVYITSGSIHVNDVSFQILKMVMHGNYIIAVGAPYETYNVVDFGVNIPKYEKRYIISNDGGNTWKYGRFGGFNDIIEGNMNAIHSAHYLLGGNAIIVGGGSDILYSISPPYIPVEGNISTQWKTFSNVYGSPTAIVSDNLINVVAITSSMTPKTPASEMVYFLTDKYVIWFEVDATIYTGSNAFYNAKTRTYGKFEHGLGSVEPLNIIKTGDYLHILTKKKYVVYTSKMSINLLNNVVVNNTLIGQYDIGSAGYFNDMAIYGENVLIVGSSSIYIAIVTEQWDGFVQPAIISTDELTSATFVNASRAFISGKLGIYYTDEYPIGWKKIPETTLSTQGDYFLVGENVNQILIKNDATFFTTRIDRTGVAGSSKIMDCYFPNLFGEDTNIVLDISGSMRISGNVNVEGGKIASTASTFNLINTNVKHVNFAGDASNVYIGNHVNSLTTANYDVAVLHDTSLNGNLFVDNNAFFHKNAVVDIDATIKRDVIVLRDMSGNRELRVDGKSFITTTLGVGRSNYAESGYILDICGNTLIRQDARIYKDATIDRDLLVKRDMSGNGELHIQGNSIIVASLGIGSTAYAGSGYTLDVCGNTLTRQNAVVYGDISANRDVIVDRDISGNSELHIQGNSIIVASLGIGSTAYAGSGYTLDVCGNSLTRQHAVVYGDISANRDVLVDRDISGGGELRIVGNSFVVSSLCVGSNAYAGSGYTLDIYGNTYTRKSAVVAVDVSINRDLIVGRDMSGNGNLRAWGATTLYRTLDVSGDTRIWGGAYVSRDVSLNQNLTVARDISGNGNLRVWGATALYRTLDVSGDMRIMGGAYVARDVSLNQNLTVARDISGNGNLSIWGATALYRTLDVSGDTRIMGGAYVARDVSLNQNLTVARDISGNGNLSVWGATALYRTLDVSGDTRIMGGAYVARDVSLNQNLTVARDISGNGNLRVWGATALYRTLDVSGDMRIMGGAYVARDVSLNQNLTVARDISGNGNLRIWGDTTLNGNTAIKKQLVVDGYSFFNDNLTVLRDTSLNENVNIGKTVTVYGNIQGKEDVVFDKTLTVIGDVSTNKLFSYGDLSANANLFVGGTTILAGDTKTKDINVDGEGTITGNIQIDQMLTVKDSLSVLKNANITGDITTVTGIITGNVLSINNGSVVNDFTVHKKMTATTASVTGTLDAGTISVATLSTTGTTTLNTVSITGTTSGKDATFTNLSSTNLVVDASASMNKLVINGTNSVSGISGTNFAVYKGNALFDLDCSINRTMKSTSAQIGTLTTTENATMNKLNITGGDGSVGSAGINVLNVGIGSALFSYDVSVNGLLKTASFDASSALIREADFIGTGNALRVKNGNALFSKDATVSGELTAEKLTVRYGGLRVMGDLNIDGKTTITNVTVAEQDVNGKMDISGVATIKDNMFVYGDASFGNIVYIPSGKVDDMSASNIEAMWANISDVSFGSMKTYSGNAFIFDVENKLTTYDATISNILDVGENSVFRKKLDVDGDLEVGGNIKLTGQLELYNGMVSTSAINTFGDLRVDNVFEVVGNSIIGGSVVDVSALLLNIVSQDTQIGGNNLDLSASSIRIGNSSGGIGTTTVNGQQLDVYSTTTNIEGTTANMNSTTTNIGGSHLSVSSSTTTVGGSQLTINTPSVNYTGTITGTTANLSNTLNLVGGTATVYAKYYEGEGVASDIYIGTRRNVSIGDVSRNIFIGTNDATQTTSTKNIIYIGGGGDEVLISGGKTIQSTSLTSDESEIGILTVNTSANMAAAYSTVLGTKFMKMGKTMHLNVYENVDISGDVGLKIYDKVNASVVTDNNEAGMPAPFSSMVMSMDKNAFVFGTNLINSSTNKVALDLTKLKSVVSSNDAVLVLKPSTRPDANYDIATSTITSSNLLLKTAGAIQTVQNGLTVQNGITVQGSATMQNGITVQGSATMQNGLTVQNSILTANNGISIAGGGATVLGGLNVNSGSIVVGMVGGFSINSDGFIKQF